MGSSWEKLFLSTLTLISSGWSAPAVHQAAWEPAWLCGNTKLQWVPYGQCLPFGSQTERKQIGQCLKGSL